MGDVSTIGLDIAKASFQAHGADSTGSVVFRKTLSRGRLLSFFAAHPRCVVAMEACAGAHHWGRELAKLGHEVRLIPPAYVKPFVKRQKNDAADAEAICEAAQRPTMRFVPVKSQDQQAATVVFRARDLLVRQRTQLLNAIRGHLAEYGHVAPKGIGYVERLITKIEDPQGDLPAAARASLTSLIALLPPLDVEIARLDREIARRAKDDPVARRLARTDASAAIDRRQAEARSDHTGGRAQLATSAGDRSQRRHQAGADPRRSGRLVAGADAGAQATDAGRGRAGQQDGSHRLGPAGQGRELSSSGAGGLIAVSSRDVEA
jgi:transposase